MKAKKELIKEVCKHKNALLKLKKQMEKQKFKIGDRVKVIEYIAFKNYKIYEGIVSRDKPEPPYYTKYQYSVNVEGTDRTLFDPCEMEIV